MREDIVIIGGGLAGTEAAWQAANRGAKVTLYLFDTGTEGGALGDSDKLQVFSGLVDAYSMDDTGITLDCIQPQLWNKPTPSKILDMSTYPNSPEGEQGVPVPKFYGSRRALALRVPHANAYTNKHYQEECGGGAGVLPLVIADPGTGASKVKLLAACHDVKTLWSPSTGYNVFALGGGELSPLTASGVTAIIAAGESSLTIDDDKMVAYFGAKPIDVRVTKSPGTIVNTATDPRRALDVLDETSFATLAQPSNARLLVQLPNLGPLGVITAVDVHQ